MPFKFENCDIKDLIIVTPQVFLDNRGFFLESYKENKIFKNGINVKFKQDNYSKSSKGVLRGLHFQIKPYEQAKLVRCVKGKILDVAVDIRPKSETFKRYVMIELSEENKKMFFIPSGFAHGFVTLSDSAEIHYKTSEEYNPNFDRGIFWADEEINIDWNINFEPILSEKDLKQPRLRELSIKELE